MRAATGLSSPRGSSLPFPRPVGLSTLYSPATQPGYLSCHLCISVSLGPAGHFTGNSRKILAIYLDSWSNWLFAWPAFPSVGMYLNVLDRTLPFPKPPSPFQPALWRQHPQPEQG